MDNSEKRAITMNTTVSIAAVIALIGGVSAMFYWREGFLTSQNELATQMTEIRADLTALSVRIDSAASDRWPKTKQEAWALRLALNNPGLVVPDPIDQSHPLPNDAGRSSP